MLLLTIALALIERPAPIPKIEPPPVTKPSIHIGIRMEAEMLISLNSLWSEEILQNRVKWMPELLQAIPEIAVEMEIMDPRETRYNFQKAEDFAADLKTINSRYHRFKDAPKVAESLRLPPRDYVNELMRFNRSYHKNMQHYAMVNLDRAELAQQIMRENDYCYKVWDAVRDARCTFYYITVRREALVTLKKLVGKENYDQLNLPPHVPLWRFQEMR
jgi:hypothetical protein